MKAPARLLLTSAVLFAAVSNSWGQINIQPTPPPIVTAENETWFQTGEPLLFAGGLYFPAGAVLHFLPYEMIRSGFYRGIPLYTRTTIEPYSFVFVPLPGSLMQPYERRRDAAMIQAAAPPMLGSPLVMVDEPMTPLEARSYAAESALQPAPTSGRAPAAAAPPAIRIRRESPNRIYVDFQNQRWYATGSPVPLDRGQLMQIGEMRGFPVYAARRGDATIYVQIAQGVDTVAQYSRRHRD